MALSLKDLRSGALGCCCPWDSHQKSPEGAKIFTRYFTVTTAKADNGFYTPDQQTLFCKDQSRVSTTFAGLPGPCVKLSQDTLEACWALRGCP